MVHVLKLMFFLIILQLALASTVYSQGGDDIIPDDVNEVSDEIVLPEIGPWANSGIVNENSPRAVRGEVTPDELCGGATFDEKIMDRDGVTMYVNLIALVPEADWNLNAVQSANCKARMTVYCLPSGVGGCKYPDMVYSITVHIVGSTGPDGNPNEYILDPSPFSAIAAQDATMIAINRVFVWPPRPPSPYVSPPDPDLLLAPILHIDDGFTLIAVSRPITPDATVCGDVTFDNNLIAMVPEAEWNQNCETTMMIYCTPSVLGDCKYTELGSSSVLVRIVGSTGPNGEPNKYILHPTPFSAIADTDASKIAIKCALYEDEDEDEEI